MKVGVLTFYHNNDNFGGQLQARALVRAINNCTGMEAEQIPYDYLHSWQKLPYKTRLLKTIQQSFSGGVCEGFNFLFSRASAQKSINDNAQLKVSLKDKLECRRRAFKRFCDETPHNSIIFDNNTIPQCLNQYDCFVCGGDQIWNDWNNWFLFNALDNFCLKFAPDSVRKFSYAPSVPLEKIRPLFIKKLADNLRQLDAVSVRERSSVPILEKTIGKKVTVVADPVLLLTQEEWDKELNPVYMNENYVFCYLLGESAENRTAAKEFAARIQCKLVTVPHMINVNEQDQSFGDIQDYTSGPAEFLSLIKNAEVVVTDSFHAAVFSMIYHKPFYVLERVTQVSGGSMGSRLTDFLIEYGLTMQKIEAGQLKLIRKVPQIDYTEADKILERRRTESYEYLRSNLKRK